MRGDLRQQGCRRPAGRGGALAFATDLTRREAIEALSAIAAGTPQAPMPTQRESFTARMDRQRSPQLGSGEWSGGSAADTPDGLARRALAAAGIQTRS